MIRYGWVLLVCALAAPAWAGSRKVTGAQLEDLLRGMKQDKKPDADVAGALKQIELTEQLTRPAMNAMVEFVPGPYSTEQMYVLEARTADLVPPASYLPATPAPDAAAQKALLARAETYVTGTYAKLPELTATRTTLRFQDNMQAVASSSGIVGSASEAVTSSGSGQANSYIRYINSTKSTVVLEHGAEKRSAEKDETRWGANRMIALQSRAPDLATVFHEAKQAGAVQWLRWELVNGRPAAVFSFAVPREVSRLDVKVCCFPSINQTGVARFYTPATAGALGGGGTAGGGVSGNYQTNTEWHEFSTTAPYHGEFFLDPDTGIVVRMIVESELKPTDVVHEVDTRVDYGPVKVGATALLVPVKTFVNTVVVPGGESGSGSYSTRTTLFMSEFTDYVGQGGRR
jgi:hypothetical protein